MHRSNEHEQAAYQCKLQFTTVTKHDYSAAAGDFFFAAAAAFFAAAAAALASFSSGSSSTMQTLLFWSNVRPALHLAQSTELVPRLPVTVRMSPKYVKFSVPQLGQGPLRMMASLNPMLVRADETV